MRRSLACVFVPVLLALSLSAAAADGWKVAHGDTANTSFVDLMTAPAASPLRIVGGLGSIADGSSPVISSSGNVYLANQQGKVMAFRPDGTKYWEQDLGSGWSVTSTPALSDFDVLFLLATRQVTDHTVSPAVERVDTDLVMFSEDGRLLGRRALPKHDFGVIPTAPLNFARGPDGQQVLVFPARYSYSGGNQVVRLFAYALVNQSAPLAEVVVSQHQEPITGESGIRFGHGFNISFDPDPTAFTRPFRAPAPGAAVPERPGQDPSLVTINDTLGSIVRYRFTGDDFVETDRWRDDQAVSGPVIARNGVNLYTRYHDVTILQLDGSKQVRGVSGTMSVTPVVRPNGVVLVPYWKGFSEAGGNARIEIGSQTAVSPTATRNHLYVSSNFGLITYRIDDLAEVARYQWQNGGRQQPAVGPQGQIYALADSKLHIFTPGVTGLDPGQVSTGVTGPLDNGVDAGNSTGGARTQPGATMEPGAVYQPAGNIGAVLAPEAAAPKEPAPEEPATEAAALPMKQKFDPPLTASGHRLSACIDDAFKQCGKEAARAFCQAQGFSKASKIDIDRKKAPAETLTGALCTKSKCDVVDEVTCER